MKGPRDLQRSCGFLDVNNLAPNATPYCSNPNYFGFWVFGSPDDGAVAGTATTGPGGVDMTLTDRAGVGGGLRLSLPNAGVVFDDADEGTVTLSQPMFYTQWVFVDVDLNSEGFEATGCIGGDSLCGGGTPAAGVAVMAQNTSFTGGVISTDQAMGVARYNVGSGAPQSPVNLSSRMQIDFLGAIDTVFLSKIGTGGAGFAVGGGCDPIGIAKEAGTPVDTGSGSFTIPFTLRVLNNLPNAATIASVLAGAEAASFPGQFSGPPAPPEIPVANLQITDNLAAVFGSGTFTAANLNTGPLTANPGFEGEGDQNLLVGNDSLQPGANVTITFDVTFTPPLDTTYPLNLTNQATVSGLAQSVPVQDLSDDGSDPGPASNNGSGGTGDPTPIVINSAPAPVPADLAVVKEAASSSVSVGDSLVYTVTVTNNSPTFTVPDPVVTDMLPAGVSLVSTLGCVEDPVGVPLCSLPSLAPLASESYLIEVVVDSAEAGETLSNFVEVSSLATVDSNPTNDSSSADVSVGSVIEIPTLGRVGFLALVLMLSLAGIKTLRVR